MNRNRSLTPARPATWLVVLAFAGLYISWGTTYLAIREGVQDFPPALFGGFRILSAGILLFAFLVWRGGPVALPWRDFGWTLLISVLMFLGGNWLLSLAELTMESASAAIIGATTPLWMALVETCWPRGERLSWRGWFGLLAGLAGVFIMFVPKLKDPTAFLHDVGPLLMLASSFTWALGTVFARRKRPSCSLLAAAAHQMLLGGAALVLVGLLCGEGARLTSEVFTARAVGSYLYLLVVGSLIGFTAFTWLLGHVRSSLVGTYAYVNPCVAVMVGWLIAGEDLTLEMLGGVATILLGVALVRSAGARALPTESQPPAERPAILLACGECESQNQACGET
jgi:drug/metabolite transporter (DMT)-like permease